MKDKLNEMLSKHSMKDKFNILEDLELSIIKARKELKKECEENYAYCEKCDDYFLKEELQTGSEEKTVNGECVYTDCGYGDDDMFADVTYLYTYYVCPKCGHHITRNKIRLKESNRRGRWN